MPAAGSQMRSSGSGRITSTIVWMTARVVKYCPAPLVDSEALRWSSSSYIVPFTSTGRLIQSSLSIRFTMSCFRSAGLCMSQREPLKMTPSMPGFRANFSMDSLYCFSRAEPSSGSSAFHPSSWGTMGVWL